MKSLIYGMGISGKSSAKYLEEKKDNFVVFDDKVNIEKYEKWNKDFSDIKRIIVSPGIPPSNKILKEAESLKIPIYCDIGLASYEKNLPQIIAVTGTAGKSTLVSLLADILNLSGKKTIALGNYGLSPLEVVDSNYEFWVIEVSSFQAKRLGKLKPNIAVYLNFSQNHLDWHKTIKDYKVSKSLLFKDQDSEDLRIVNKNIEKKYILGNAREKIIKENEFSRIREDIHQETLSVIGTCVKELNLNKDIAKKAIQDFTTLMHRYEKVNTNDGIQWINDSKATTPLATLTAIDRTPEKSIVLMGGSDKDLDYEETLKKIKKKNMKLIPFGRISSSLYTEAHQLDVKSSKPCSCLKKAIKKAKIDGLGKTVLLSPGTASFDEFKNYEERGTYFVKQIKGGRYG